jgi:cholesterol transport system auxiliary component
VTYDAVLTTPNGVALARQRFTASAPVNGKIEAGTIGGPLNSAANMVARDVAAWAATVKE